MPRAFLLSLLSGLLLALSFPDAGLWPLAWIGLVPLLVALRDRTPKQGFILGFSCGVVYWGMLLYWVTYVIAVPAHLPLALGLLANAGIVWGLALLVGVFGWAIRKTALPAWIAAPVLWVGLEQVRAPFLPVCGLGVSQVPWRTLVQAADVGGVALLSLVVVGVNAALVERRRLPLGLAVLGLGAALVYGHLRLDRVEADVAASPTLQVAVVQGNVPQDRKWENGLQAQTVAIYRRLTDAADADLVIWPETAMPFDLLSEDRFTPLVLDGLASTVLTGSPAAEGARRYNRAWLLSPDGTVLGTRDKARLVPFGEYVPFREHLPFLSTLDRSAHDFDPAPERGVIRWDGADLGVLVCFESLFPDMARAQVRDGADLLVVVTNDAWFGQTSALAQHLSYAVLRAVETRRSVIQAANTGISGVVDPTGRVRARTVVETRARIDAEVALPVSRTLYSRWGDGIGWLCLALGLAGFRRRPVRA